MRGATIAVLFVACMAAPDAQGAPAATRVVDGPCTGCRAVLPVSSSPVPLLVVLHGDWGAGPNEMLTAWQPHVLAEGIGVLALACPKDKGCKGSFWRWNGDPSWVTAQVDALAAKHPIDRARVWLAGWSGGASYMGMHAEAFARDFAALVYHGGGIPPSNAACATVEGGRAAAFFLVGDRNPLHGLAVALRDHHVQCAGTRPDEVQWNLVRGADHEGEWRALATAGPRVVSWLKKRRREPVDKT
jgi:poly(3-hydroxybutyrate) depolymerase